MIGCPSVTDTLFAFDPQGIHVGFTTGFTMRSAAEPVKLQFNHVSRVRISANAQRSQSGNITVQVGNKPRECKSAILARKNTAIIDIFAPIVGFSKNAECSPRPD
jgi:hypothetical protein